MQRLQSFVKAKRYFTDTFAPERQKVIKDFKRQRDEIEREETIRDKGSIFCLYVGLFGGVLSVGSVLSTPFVLKAGVTVLVSSSLAVILLYIFQNYKKKRFLSTLKGPTKNMKDIVQE